MRFLFDFGISQDDPNIEGSALDLEGNNLLCIASGGEVPLSLLSRFNTNIRSIDSSLNQILLCKLKFASILNLEPGEAAIFIGFKKGVQKLWGMYFHHLKKGLSDFEINFWTKNMKNVTMGPIRYSRFERYISIFCKILLGIVGRKRFIKLFELESIDAQCSYFDTYISRKVIYCIFKIAFSPLLYSKRGLDQRALTHKRKNMALEFYNRFRDFCTATPAWLNYYLQFYFLGEVIHDEALPEYLQPSGIYNIRKHKENLSFEVKTIQEEILGTEKLTYRNYALSNISDWLTVEEMDNLLLEIDARTTCNSKILLRYLHKNPVNDKIGHLPLQQILFESEDIKAMDRFPFYSFVKGEFGQ